MHSDVWESPEQSDANRTARIVLVAIDRSIAAWRLMMDEFTEREDDILEALALLAKLRRLTETTFPRWVEAGPAVEW